MRMHPALAGAKIGDGTASRVIDDAINRLSGPRTTNRGRRSKAEMQAIEDAIIDCLKQDHPQSTRHIFYRLCEPPYRVVPKDQVKGYRPVQRKVLELRKREVIPWSWVSDSTRWRIVQPSFDNVAEAIRHTAETYRRDLWRRTPAYVEVWSESDSMAGTIVQETECYNVPLMVSRGFSSWTFLESAARAIKAQRKPAHLYYVGDWDPSGRLIPQKIEQTIRGFAPEIEVHFTRLLVTPEQIAEWSLPTKPAKATTHAKGFTGGTVEAEAIPAHVTRRIVREAIERHLDRREVEVIEAAEESERAHIEWLASLQSTGGRP